jgi:hypothetical protein
MVTTFPAAALASPFLLASGSLVILDRRLLPQHLGGVSSIVNGPVGGRRAPRNRSKMTCRVLYTSVSPQWLVLSRQGGYPNRQEMPICRHLIEAL